MAQEPLLTPLLDLDATLNSNPRLIVGGGYGLYLKLYLRDNRQIRTLFDVSMICRPHGLLKTST